MRLFTGCLSDIQVKPAAPASSSVGTAVYCPKALNLSSNYYVKVIKYNIFFLSLLGLRFNGLWTYEPSDKMFEHFVCDVCSIARRAIFRQKNTSRNQKSTICASKHYEMQQAKLKFLRCEIADRKDVAPFLSC